MNKTSKPAHRQLWQLTVASWRSSWKRQHFMFDTCLAHKAYSINLTEDLWDLWKQVYP